MYRKNAKVRNALLVGLILLVNAGCSRQFTPDLSQLRSGDSRMVAVLHGSPSFPNAQGKARFRDRGGEREFQLEVEQVRVLAGKTLGVFVSGVRYGGARVNGFGEARLNLNSDNGQRVPSVRSGTRVQVKTAAGKTVVAGSF